MWIDDLSGQITPVAYTGSKSVALPALTPQPLIGHAEGVVAASTCFGDRNPHSYEGTAADLSQGVDEELPLREFVDEDQLMALSQEAMTVAHKDWQGIFQTFPREGRPQMMKKSGPKFWGFWNTKSSRKCILATFLCPIKARAMMEKARNRLRVPLSRELHPIVFGYLRGGIGAGKQGYHRDHPIDALPSGNIALSCFMSLSGYLVDPVENAITWVFCSVRGLPKP